MARGRTSIKHPITHPRPRASKYENGKKANCEAKTPSVYVVTACCFYSFMTLYLAYVHIIRAMCMAMCKGATLTIRVHPLYCIEGSRQSVSPREIATTSDGADRGLCILRVGDEGGGAHGYLTVVCSLTASPIL